MKKLILSMAMVAAFAAFADDTTTYQALYWQVNAEDTTSFGDASYAVLYASLDGGNVKIAGDGQLVNAGAVGQTQTVLQGAGSTFSWGAYDFTTANFFVELLNEGGAFLAQSESVGYSTLLNGGYIATQGAGMPSPTTATPYAFGAYAVPEPTSGLLMLLGIAGLALRRKRA